MLLKYSCFRVSLRTTSTLNAMAGCRLSKINFMLGLCIGWSLACSVAKEVGLAGAEQNLVVHYEVQVKEFMDIPVSNGKFIALIV